MNNKHLVVFLAILTGAVLINFMMPRHTPRVLTAKEQERIKCINTMQSQDIVMSGDWKKTSSREDIDKLCAATGH